MVQQSWGLKHNLEGGKTTARSQAGLSRWCGGKQSTCKAGNPDSTPEPGSLLEKEMATHSSTLPGKSHGQRSLADHSRRGHKESDTTERLNSNDKVKQSTWSTFLLIHLTANSVTLL